jgi:ribosomal protein S18 acetylase RimI-like enzyme
MIKKIESKIEPIHLVYEYESSFFYDVKVKELGFEFVLTKFDQPVHKHFEEDLFQPYIENPDVFTYEIDSKQVGFIEGSIESWHQVYRIWNFVVKKEYRHQKIGDKLMKASIDQAKRLNCRAIVLEVQSCNYPAIQFYLKQGFTFIGLDILAYSNEDITKKEVRLEMGMTL